MVWQKNNIHSVLAVFLRGVSMRTYILSNIMNKFVTSASKGLIDLLPLTSQIDARHNPCDPLSKVHFLHC